MFVAWLDWGSKEGIGEVTAHHVPQLGGELHVPLCRDGGSASNPGAAAHRSVTGASDTSESLFLN